MNQSRSDEMVNSVIDETVIIEYLQAYPDLLQRYPQLLEQLHLPHDCGTATSLVERQTQILRKRLQDCSGKLSTLVHTARQNEIQFEKTRNLVLALTACQHLDCFSMLLYNCFCDDFNADDVSLILFARPDISATHADLRWVVWPEAQHHLSNLLTHKWALCQLPKASQMQYLFVTSTHVQEFHSAALLPLWLNEQLLGLCCVASKQEDHFDEQLDTLFLNHVADVSSQALGRLLQIPAS